MMTLNQHYRNEALKALQTDHFDVVVIGGGITGVGAALDAVSRGLSVALIEARDYAAGTSSKSSKLIHGGLRYLEMLDFSLVREALRERELLLTRLAPHLVKPVPFLWPLKHRLWERIYLGAGLILYDTIGGARSVPRARHLTKTAALREAPGLRSDCMIGAVQFYDAREDDARMVVAVARTAAKYGAIMTTNIRADGFIRTDERVSGVRATDLLSGDELTINARHVVSAAGVWSQDIVGMLGTDVAPSTSEVRPSKGIHIVVPRDRIASSTGILTRTEKSVLFIIPWGDHWIIGDTDDDWTFDRVNPVATHTNVDYLLAKANTVLSKPLTHSDIKSVFTGLRPLVAPQSASESTKISREHAIQTLAPGLSAIAGGKYTTYRVMAADLVDAAVADLPASTPSSCTDTTPLIGAEGYQVLRNQTHLLAGRERLSADEVNRLLNRYGDRIVELFDLMKTSPSLREPIPGAEGYLAAEAVYAVSHEGALHLDDVLARRMRVTIETEDRGCKAAPIVAKLIAPSLNWSDEDIDREVGSYVSGVEADIASQHVDDDEEANALRLRTPDLLQYYASGSSAPTPTGTIGLQ